MPQVIKPTKVVTVTKDGECKVDITIDLTIHLDSSGLKVSSQVAAAQQETEVDETKWAIPTFGNAGQVSFGKSEQEEK